MTPAFDWYLLIYPRVPARWFSYCGNCRTLCIRRIYFCQNKKIAWDTRSAPVLL